jgi:hypothetical protein
MKNVLPFAVLVITLQACVSVKPSTVQLSAEVGQRITEMEKLHLLTIQRYFDQQKQQIEDFMTDTWEPLFLENFLGATGIIADLQNASTIDEQRRRAIRESIAHYLTDTSEATRAADDLIKALNASRKGEPAVVRTTLSRYVPDASVDVAASHISALLGTDEPARMILDFAAEAHKQMDIQRKELLAPIEEAEKQTMAALGEAYAELIRGQSMITGRLEAAAKVSRQQDELMDKLGVKKIEEQMVPKLSAISGKVVEALGKARDALQTVDKGSSSRVIADLKNALNEISNETK